jgi:hypothetical protein
MRVNVDITQYKTLCDIVIKWIGGGNNVTVAKTQDSQNQCYVEKAKPSKKESLYATSRYSS